MCVRETKEHVKSVQGPGNLHPKKRQAAADVGGPWIPHKHSTNWDAGFESTLSYLPICAPRKATKTPSALVFSHTK